LAAKSNKGYYYYTDKAKQRCIITIRLLIIKNKIRWLKVRTPSSIVALAMSICRKCLSSDGHWYEVKSAERSLKCGMERIVASLYAGCATNCSSMSPNRQNTTSNLTHKQICHILSACQFTNEQKYTPRPTNLTDCIQTSHVQ